MQKPYYDLRTVKANILAGRVYLVHRKKNLATLDDLGFADADAFAEIANLKVTQFASTDWERGRAADVYKKTILGRVIYIKFFIENDLVVLSFHHDGMRGR